jgi:predicted nucleic acid-binding protein
MKDEVFFDSNLWIYLYSEDDKSAIVSQIINKHFDHIKISTQVLGECFNVLTKKKIKTLEQTKEIIDNIASVTEVLGIDKLLVTKAIEIHTKYKYSYYDSLIIASALENGCTILYTEDMQNGQIIDEKLTIINPFVKPKK